MPHIDNGNQKVSACNQLNLETLEFQPIVPKFSQDTGW